MFGRGVVCIVTNTFNEMHETAWPLKRESWKVDREKILSTFKSKKFKIVLKENHNKNDILTALRTIGYKTDGKTIVTKNFFFTKIHP